MNVAVIVTTPAASAVTLIAPDDCPIGMIIDPGIVAIPPGDPETVIVLSAIAAEDKFTCSDAVAPTDKLRDDGVMFATTGATAAPPVLIVM